MDRADDKRAPLNFLTFLIFPPSYNSITGFLQRVKITHVIQSNPLSSLLRQIYQQPERIKSPREKDRQRKRRKERKKESIDR